MKSLSNYIHTLSIYLPNSDTSKLQNEIQGQFLSWFKSWTFFLQVY